MEEEVTPEQRAREVAELRAHWHAETPFQVCFWCEDRPAVGYLVLVHARSRRAVARRRKGDARPVVCDFCRFDCHEREVELPTGKKATWVFVSFNR